MSRIGLLGGAFNPPHVGHLALAQLALDHLALDELRFVPTHASPLKAAVPHSPDDATRLRLLEAALRELPGPFVIETAELQRPGPSYTVDTLEALGAAEPQHSWIWIVGGDQLAQFPVWHRWERVLELASLAAAWRPGATNEVPEILSSRVKFRWSGQPGEIVRLPSTELDFSSSHIRRSLASGDPTPALPSQVRAVIERETLYR